MAVAIATEQALVPFPRTRDWASLLPPDRRAEFAEYLYPAAYHLNWATELAVRAQRIVYKPQWAPPDFASRSIRLLSWDIDEGAFFGGSAVLETGAALEAALQLMNHVLPLGLPKDRVWWSRKPEGDGFHRRLNDLHDAMAPALISAVRRVYNSIGSELLGTYRNWALHRGALRVTYEIDLQKPVPFPGEIPSEDDPRHRDFVLEGMLYQRLATSAAVTSSTFVPPAQARYRGTPNPPAEDFVSGPLRIDKSARPVILGDLVVSTGNLFEDADAYRAKNPVSLDDRRVRVADEDLGKYTPVTFVMAVAQVVDFARTSVIDVLDPPLVEILRSRI